MFWSMKGLVKRREGGGREGCPSLNQHQHNIIISCLQPNHKAGGTGLVTTILCSMNIIFQDFNKSIYLTTTEGQPSILVGSDLR